MSFKHSFNYVLVFYFILNINRTVTVVVNQHKLVHLEKSAFIESEADYQIEFRKPTDMRPLSV